MLFRVRSSACSRRVASSSWLATLLLWRSSRTRASTAFVCSIVSGSWLASAFWLQFMRCCCPPRLRMSSSVGTDLRITSRRCCHSALPSSGGSLGPTLTRTFFEAHFDDIGRGAGGAVSRAFVAVVEWEAVVCTLMAETGRVSGAPGGGVDGVADLGRFICCNSAASPYGETRLTVLLTVAVLFLLSRAYSCRRCVFTVLSTDATVVSAGCVRTDSERSELDTTSSSLLLFAPRPTLLLLLLLILLLLFIADEGFPFVDVDGCCCCWLTDCTKSYSKSDSRRRSCSTRRSASWNIATRREKEVDGCSCCCRCISRSKTSDCVSRETMLAPISSLSSNSPSLKVSACGRASDSVMLRTTSLLWSTYGRARVFTTPSPK
eukprot:PhM_4_TR5145/c7_g1_i1/m.75526